MLIIYIIIYIHIFIHLFSVISSFCFFVFFLLWRYWWDILLFASVPVTPLRGVASGRRRASLVPELEAPSASGAVAAVIALRVTFTWWSALLELPPPLPVVAFLLLVYRAAAGARLLGLVHPQLAQWLASCGSCGSWGRGRGRGGGCRGRVLRRPLAHLSIAELARLLKQVREGAQLQRQKKATQTESCIQTHSD